jgi:NAD(P)-dependent dehydrogenase (short-subunit alcohol dehydrogenase family)
MAPSFDNNSVWLITGCSTGSLGESIVKYIHAAGHNVVATARNVNSLSYLPDSPKLLKLALDVTSRESITTTIDTTLQHFGRLDVLVNSAGYAVTSELESFPEEEARQQMETMFWGPVHLTKEAICIFREVNTPNQGGTIVQVSSIGGFIGFQGHAFYNARFVFHHTLLFLSH